MKLKIRFPDRLCPFRKPDHNLLPTIPPAPDKTKLKYSIGLLILWLVVMLSGALRCSAQIRPLKVGDKVPDTEFTRVLNYKSTSLRLSDFKNKVVVLDFWATWCTSCLARFPAERALQRRMGDTLQIILVNPKNTRNTHSKVAAFFKERRGLYDFPSIDEDTILSQWFPGLAVPRFAWIRNNVVVALPEPEALTAGNIRAVYDKRKVSMASGKKSRPDFRTAFLGNNLNSSTGIRYYSFIGDYRQDLYPSFNMETDSAGDVIRLDAVDMSVNDLLQLCTPSTGIPAQRTIRHVADQDEFSADSSSLSWRIKYRFVYESTFSPRSPDAARALMRGEIGRYFQLRVDTVTRDTACYVITLGDSSKIVHGKKGIHGETNIYDHLNTPIFFHDESMTAIAATLEDQFGTPFVNDTGVRGKVDIDLPPSFSDFPRVAAAFRRQGFHIARAMRRLTYLRIEDEPMPTKRMTTINH